MNEHEIYRPPRSELTTDADVFITYRMLELMNKTRRWVLLVGIVGLVVTAISGIGTVLEMASDGDPLLSMGCSAFGALVWLLPSLLLLRFAGAIRKFTGGGGAAAMEEALARQNSFWCLIGILLLVVVSLFVVLMIATTTTSVPDWIQGLS